MKDAYPYITWMFTASKEMQIQSTLMNFFFGSGVTVIEWGHLLGEALPADYLELEILKDGEGREVVFHAHGQRATELFEEAYEWSMIY